MGIFGKNKKENFIEDDGSQDENKSNFDNNKDASENIYQGVEPELVPIVTLLASQAHRRYQEGIFMLYHDINNEGHAASQEWQEVYGIFTGNVLAYWDAANLANFARNPEALLQTRPSYLNFTDAVYHAKKSIPASKRSLENVIVLSSTWKNRFIMQFKSEREMQEWYLAFRLSNYESTSLQEAYTGALLSAKGSRLSDIRTILAEKRFNHEDWVSIRYSSGMAWKKCFAVVEPSASKRKHFSPGRILFFDNEKKKKKGLLGVVLNASSVRAIYPESPMLIDHSTLLKLDVTINYISPSLSEKGESQSFNDFRESPLFLMPHQHSSVSGFDTLIRFLVPLLDAFGLYGRPKRLKADRLDPDSLLFGLPTLPHVHYLENLEELLQLAKRADFFSMDTKQWNILFKDIMLAKLRQGYTGCGSSRGFAGARKSLSSEKRKSTLLNPDEAPPAQQLPLHSLSGGVRSKGQTDSGRSGPKVEISNSELAGSVSGSDRERREIDENSLPRAFQKVNLSTKPSANAYPTDDDHILNYGDGSVDDDSEDNRHLNVGRQVSEGANLKVPGNDTTDSSNSSIKSPMTQYNEFSNKVNQNLDISDKSKVNITKSQPLYNLAGNMSNSSPSLGGSSSYYGSDVNVSGSSTRVPSRGNMPDNSGPLQSSFAGKRYYEGKGQEARADYQPFYRPDRRQQAPYNPAARQPGPPILSKMQPHQGKHAYAAHLQAAQAKYPKSLQFGYTPPPQPVQPRSGPSAAPAGSQPYNGNIHYFHGKPQGATSIPRSTRGPLRPPAGPTGYPVRGDHPRYGPPPGGMNQDRHPPIRSNHNFNGNPYGYPEMQMRRY